MDKNWYAEQIFSLCEINRVKHEVEMSLNRRATLQDVVSVSLCGVPIYETEYSGELEEADILDGICKRFDIEQMSDIYDCAANLESAKKYGKFHKFMIEQSEIEKLKEAIQRNERVA